ncbi:quinone oxidoreductase [Shinella sp.]|uniref:quinone oxidoreductase family protein n=1 Tax=Shinella sp. TaxID=1870904 RepID=UPI0028AC94F9|nr:quinone oxidoreductase [Shinella sp.]
MAPIIAGAVVARKPGGPEVLEWAEFAVDTPGPGEVLIRQEAAGLNFIDTYYRSGLYPWPGEMLVPGAEAAGTVVAIGPGVEDFSVGQRVAYLERTGAYREMRVMPAERLFLLPDGIDTALAASVLLKGLTAQALVSTAAPVKAGQTILVHAAAGGVGLLLGQWISALGARAIGTAGSPEKAELARAHGYDAVIEYRREDFAARVAELTDGALCDTVFDAVGKDTWRGSLSSLRPHGRFVNFGQASGPIEGFKISDLAAGSKSVIRPVVFDYLTGAQERRQRSAELFARLADGSLRAGAASSIPLREAARAHRALEGRATTGSTILTMDGFSA